MTKNPPEKDKKLKIINLSKGGLPVRKIQAPVWGPEIFRGPKISEKVVNNVFFHL